MITPTATRVAAALEALDAPPEMIDDVVMSTARLMADLERSGDEGVARAAGDWLDDLAAEALIPAGGA